MTDDGQPSRMFSRNRWGHGETITLDGSHLLFQNFKHDGIWLTRFDDGQLVDDVRYEPLPKPSPDYGSVCGSQAHPFRKFRRIANSNVWIYQYLHPRWGVKHREQDEGCYFNAVWNWRTNSHIRIHGPEDGTWMPRCDSESAIGCAGIWKGYDLPEVDEHSAYLVPYRENVTFSTARQNRPIEKTVRIGNIDDRTVEGLSVQVTPPSAAHWLEAAMRTTGTSSLTVTLRVDPASVTQPGHAEVTVRAASARNTASFTVHADNTMLPRPGSFVVFHANMNDSFAYPRLTWEDNAQGEDGYLVEFFTDHDSNTTWKVIDTIGPDRNHYISPLHEYTDETMSGRYRIRAFTDDGLFSPYSDAGGFGVPPDSLVPPPRERILEPWTSDIVSTGRRHERVTRCSGVGSIPPISYDNGVIRVHRGVLFPHGFVSIALPNGRVIMRRPIADACEHPGGFSLPLRAAGVVLITIDDTKGDSRTLRTIVAH